MMQSCQDDMLTGQPDWLGNSIYERLQEDGHYTNVLRLIDDLDMKEVLGHTGSRTIFVANDSAYAEWFKKNSWDIDSYEDLTSAQKKMLLNNSMISNAYLIELMSNVSGTPPVEGKAMRRETVSSIYDSVYIMHPDKMPDTEAWATLKAKGKSVPILKDALSAPMIHFLPSYMDFNEITAEDLSILTNHQASSINEAWVNGRRVIERDITCKNGYIQKVDGVIESTPNMAEILRQHPQMSLWSHLIDRFSAPYRNDVATREYNRIYNNEDTVYTLRYFSKRAAITQRADKPNNIMIMPDGTTTVPAQLRFDPGWNHYMYSNTMGYDLHYDAGAMIVPTNEALEAWWNESGKDLQDEYKTWDNIPYETLAKLLNVNMLDAFSSSVPSKFNTVLNDAKDMLGIKKEHVDSCFIGCNGVVYLVNKVFSPAEYASVAYPALAHESTMNVIYCAIENLNFLPYLLSMDSRYAMILPSNTAMLMYLDPASYGNVDVMTDAEAPHLIKISRDKSEAIGIGQLHASRYLTTVDADGNITEGIQSQANVDNSVISNMMNDLLENLIIVIPDTSMTLEKYVDKGFEYFKTKGGALIRVTKAENGNMAFEGGWQMEHNHKKLVADEVFIKSNGRAYMLNEQMPLGAEKSLYMTLKEHDEYSGFLRLLENDYTNYESKKSLLSVEMSSYQPGNLRNGNKNFRLFDNYNYTVFVPSTTAIEQLQANGELPSWSELEMDFPKGSKHINPATGKEYESVLDSICYAEGWYSHFAKSSSSGALDTVRINVAKCLQDIIIDFVRYHVMDRSVAIGMAPEANAQGTSYESMKRNPETGRFYPLTVEYDQNNLTVTDLRGVSQQVVKTEGLYNNICREYWFDIPEGAANKTTLYMSSDAVAHLINQPLYYDKKVRKWRDVVVEYLTNN